jgi:hypothetical protein
MGRTRPHTGFGWTWGLDIGVDMEVDMGVDIGVEGTAILAE